MTQYDKTALAILDNSKGIEVSKAMRDDPELRKEFDEAQAIANEGVELGLPQMAIVHAEAKFKTPNEIYISSFAGVIVDTNLTNAYWAPSDTPSEGNAPPDCVSYDGYLPDESAKDKQGSTCVSCPMNEFGSSAKGRGKACKNMRRLAIFTDVDGEGMVVRLTLSPSSLKAYISYVRSLGRNKTPFSVQTSFKAVRKESGDRTQKWTIVDFEYLNELTPQQFSIARKIGKELLDMRRESIKKSVEYGETDDAKTEAQPAEEPAWTEKATPADTSFNTAEFDNKTKTTVAGRKGI